MSDAWERADAPADPLPRLEDLPVAEQGYDRDAVRHAFDAFYRHAAQLDATLRVLESVEAFGKQARELRADIRALRVASWAPTPAPRPLAAGYGRTSRRVEGVVPDALPRLAVEAAFIVLVAVGAALAELSVGLIVLLVVAAWLIVGVAEFLASGRRATLRPGLLPAPARADVAVSAAAGPLPVAEAVAAPPPSEETRVEPTPEPEPEVGAAEPEPAREAEPEPVPEVPPAATAQPTAAPARRRFWRRRERAGEEEAPSFESRHVRVVPAPAAADESPPARDPWEDDADFPVSADPARERGAEPLEPEPAEPVEFVAREDREDAVPETEPPATAAVHSEDALAAEAAADEDTAPEAEPLGRWALAESEPRTASAWEPLEGPREPEPPEPAVEPSPAAEALPEPPEPEPLDEEEPVAEPASAFAEAEPEPAPEGVLEPAGDAPPEPAAEAAPEPFDEPEPALEPHPAAETPAGPQAGEPEGRSAPDATAVEPAERGRRRFWRRRGERPDESVADAPAAAPSELEAQETSGQEEEQEDAWAAPRASIAHDDDVFAGAAGESQAEPVLDAEPIAEFEPAPGPAPEPTREPVLDAEPTPEPQPSVEPEPPERPARRRFWRRERETRGAREEPAEAAPSRHVRRIEVEPAVDPDRVAVPWEAEAPFAAEPKPADTWMQSGEPAAFELDETLDEPEAEVAAPVASASGEEGGEAERDGPGDRPIPAAAPRPERSELRWRRGRR
jgi:hypothetical protein